jgi:patatin-like phospholipase
VTTSATSPRTALVLAGGGVAGIAWELGVLQGIADVAPALADRVLAADLVVGTSAGSSVAAQITSGVPLEELYAAQLRPETAEIEVDVDLVALFADLGEAVADASDAADARRRVGAVALAAPSVDPVARLAAIAARLPVPGWSDRRVLETFPAVQLAEATLETGRTHQVRVHLASLRHPLAGDRAYGADPTLAARLGLTRPFLHAWRLAFDHPTDGRRVELTEPLPDDLQPVLDRLRG